MVGIGELFGEGSIGQQMLVWQVLAQVIGAAISPGTTEISKLVNSAVPTTPLSPQTAAGLVARGLIDHGTGKDIANDSGVGGQDFDKLVHAASSAPDIAAVIDAYRRGLIGAGGDNGQQASLAGALTDAGIRPEWIPVLEKLAVQIPSVAEVMNAWLEGQIDEGEAHRRYLAAGGDPTWFQTSYNALGQAPTPSEALDLLNRGIIPESGTGPASVSYEQAFLEGPWRNKWLGPFKALRRYFPPPRTVTAMFHQNQLSHDQAARYLAAQGLDPELVAAYLSHGKAAHVAADKVLAKSEILSLYTDKLISKTKAITSLEALKYTAADAALLVQLEDLRLSRSQLSQGITHVRTLFEAGKITGTVAERSLQSLEVPPESARDIVHTWEIGRTQHVRTLTSAQVESAWFYDLMPTDEALNRLVMMGYDELDAWMLLSIRGKAPLKGVPRPS